MSKKNKFKALEDSLSEAINPSPVSRTVRQNTVSDMLSSYRGEKQEKIVDVHNEESAPSTIQFPAVRMENDLPSTVLKDSRPQDKNVTSTDKKLDGLPSTEENLPSTNTGYTSVVDGKPSTVKIVDVHSVKRSPSTKSDRHKPGKARYDNRIDSKIKQKIKEFCAKEQFDQNEFAEISAVHFMDAWTSTKIQNVDGKPAHDDRRLNLWKTTPRIINLYLAYNSIFNDKSKWSVRDDDAGLPFNNVDIRIIELGILQTQANKGFSGKINSFNYYVPEIKNFIELKMPEMSLTTILEINRQRWRQATGREIDLNFLKSKWEIKNDVDTPEGLN